MLAGLYTTVMLALFFATPKASAFYMTNVPPQSFGKGDEVPMKVNAMTSIHTQIPKPYYLLPFCQPEGNSPKMASEYHGEFLTGNKLQTSPYTIYMLQDTFCQRLCQVQIDAKQTQLLKKHILYGYHNNWIIDNLPSASEIVSDIGQSRKHYNGGFPIGFIDRNSGKKQDAYIFNHVNIKLDFHEPAGTTGEYHVVGFSVEPLSIDHSFLGGYEWNGESQEGFTKILSTCTVGQHMEKKAIRKNQIVKENEKILFTYDVEWKKSDAAWSSRWDVYLNEGNFIIPPQIHWNSIATSIFVVVFLSLVVSSILIWNLKRDIAGYNAAAALADEDDVADVDESGWKSVHADVFRPPSTMPMVYCVLVGSGVQLVISTLCAFCLAAIGFIDPSRRGSMLNYILIFYTICGIFAGYTSSRLYKSFCGRACQVCTLATATLFPGTCFIVFLFLNTVLAFYGSSGSVPFLDVLIMAAMWCCVSIPLVFIGAYFGYKKESIEFPTETSSIARAIPEPGTLLMNPKVGMVVAGIVPFKGAYVQLLLFMTSLWFHQYYNAYGLNLVVYLILLITSAEITTLVIYYQLVAENHRWWWLAMMTSGSVSLYIFGYSFVWFQDFDPSNLLCTYIIYFGYMFLLCFTIFLVTGAVGSLTTLWFVKQIFGSSKVFSVEKEEFPEAPSSDELPKEQGERDAKENVGVNDQQKGDSSQANATSNE